MYDYAKELNILKKTSTYVKEYEINGDFIDLTSTDYLGLSKNKETLKLSYERARNSNSHSSFKRLTENIHSEIHKDLNNLVTKISEFETSLLMSSKYIATISTIEALLNSNTDILIDENHYITSILGTKLSSNRIRTFKHNSYIALKNELYNSKCNNKNIVIMVEGLYSKNLEILNKKIFDLTIEFDSYLVVDESHSNGLIGISLGGVFDLFDIKPKDNYIKIFELNNAYASSGAVILMSSKSKEILLNRSVTILNSDTISTLDASLAYYNMNYINDNKYSLKKMIEERIRATKNITNKEIKTLTFSLKASNIKQLDLIQKDLMKDKFLITTIKPPIVEYSMLKLSLNLSLNIETVNKLLHRLNNVF